MQVRGGGGIQMLLFWLIFKAVVGNYAKEGRAVLLPELHYPQSSAGVK